MKILAIGNSFSVDAMTYLYDIARSEGMKELTLGNLYIGGCTLQTHANNARENRPAYQYFKASAKTAGRFTERPRARLADGLADEDWDIITMQQASGSSGMPDTYAAPLSSLVAYVNKNKTNRDARLAWHMTWAYQEDSTHEEFFKYRHSQDEMYRAILHAVRQEVLPTGAFSLLIPSGSAIQRARLTFGDTLTRDGYHLNEKGKFIAGYTWFSALTGQPLARLAFCPTALALSQNDQEAIRAAVSAACAEPFLLP